MRSVPFCALVGVVACAVHAPAAMAASPAPRVLSASPLSVKRVDHRFFSMSAVVRLSRALTADERGRLGLISTQWAYRRHLRAGSRLPDALFAGTSLGRIGAAGRHCYLAETANFGPHHSVRVGGSWAVALHDGHRVISAAPRTTARRIQATDPRAQARSIDC